MSGFDSLMLTPLKAPCRNCNKRNQYCHSTCGDYKRFNDENEKIRNEKLKKVHISDTLRRNAINRSNKLSASGIKLKHGKH